jgi:FkbM family methyltransferase
MGQLNISGRFLYNLSVMIFARPKFQPFFLKLFRVNLGYLGYMNWSPDFKLTGEKLALKKLKVYGIDKVLDIGANKGQWANMALDTLNCKVISIEPQSLAFEKLNLLKNKYGEKIQTLKLAIGDLNKEIQINVHIASSELSFIDNRLKKMPLLYGKTESQELVTMVTLDSLFETEPELLSNIDLIKIDTEGFEINVLNGGLNYIHTVSPKFIQLEINWHQLFVNSSLLTFSELLANYDVYKLLPSGECLLQINPTDPVNNLYQLSNVMFVRQDISLKVMSKRKL